MLWLSAYQASTATATAAAAYLISAAYLDICVGPFAIFVVFSIPLSREMGYDLGVFGRFDLAALVQPHL